MNTIVQIDGMDLTVARLDNSAYYLLMEAGALPNHGRTELIEGVLVPMAASKSAHGTVLASLITHLGANIPAGLRAGIDIAIDFAEGLVLAPDIAVFPRQYRGEKIPGHEIALLVEISASSLGHDLDLKAKLYAQRGVPYYWVVDIEGRSTHLHMQPGPKGYGLIESKSWDEAIFAPFAMDKKMILTEILDL